MKNLPATAVIFCKVVDNYGDIGICWRLARQMHDEYDISVTLWVDDLASFQRLCPDVDPHAGKQSVAGVTVRHWRDQTSVFETTEIAELVIEFFGCDIPDGYIAAMARCGPQPVWLNLEGLSAEAWVEGCHTLSSPHPRLPLTKYFFFPGFAGKTGGLLQEAGLQAERGAFQSDPVAVGRFLAGLGLTPAEAAGFKVSLFCYPHALLPLLFDAWRCSAAPVTCLVPEGVAVEAVKGFLGGPALPGAVCTQGVLTLRVIPFLSQSDYDRLLWACDLNLVRGEDSFVRAQWAGRPFLWHIYPQDKDLHHVKLRAFLQRYVADAEGAEGASPAADLSIAGAGMIDRTGLANWRSAMLLWNGDFDLQGNAGTDLRSTAAANLQANTAAVGQDPGTPQTDWTLLWPALLDAMPAMTAAAASWQCQMQGLGDLTSNLLAFAAALRSATEKITV